MGRRPSQSFLSRHHASVVSSSSRSGRGVSLSLHGQARSTKHCSSCVQRACPNSRSSLAGLRASCHRCFLTWRGRVSCFFCMVLLLGSEVKQTLLE